jgi:hypothetical protein
VHLLTCCNSSLGFITKARVCKGASQKLSPGITFHVPGSARECEGMNPHTPKLAPTLGVGILMDSWIFKGPLHGSKLNLLRSSLYNWKNLRTKMVKMGLHDPFGFLKLKLWPKEGPWVKLAVWLTTIKGQESLCAGGMSHTFEKILMRATLLF